MPITFSHMPDLGIVAYQARRAGQAQAERENYIRSIANGQQYQMHREDLGFRAYALQNSNEQSQINREWEATQGGVGRDFTAEQNKLNRESQLGLYDKQQQAYNQRAKDRSAAALAENEQAAQIDFHQSSIEALDKDVGASLKTLSSRDLSPEGKQVAGGLMTKYRAIQSNRGVMKPEQYLDTMNKWRSEVQQSWNPEIHETKPVTPTDVMNSNIMDSQTNLPATADTPMERRVWVAQDKDGNWQKPEPIMRSSASSTPTGPNPLKDFSSPTASVTIEETALQNIRTRKLPALQEEERVNEEEIDDYVKKSDIQLESSIVPTDAELDAEIQAIYANRRRRAGLPPATVPTGTSSTTGGSTTGTATAPGSTAPPPAVTPENGSRFPPATPVTPPVAATETGGSFLDSFGMEGDTPAVITPETAPEVTPGATAATPEAAEPTVNLSSEYEVSTEHPAFKYILADKAADKSSLPVLKDYLKKGKSKKDLQPIRVSGNELRKWGGMKEDGTFIPSDLFRQKNFEDILKKINKKTKANPNGNHIDGTKAKPIVMSYEQFLDNIQYLPKGTWVKHDPAPAGNTTSVVK